VLLHCIALAQVALQLCCLYDACLRFLPFHIISTEHSIITQAVTEFCASLAAYTECIDLFVIDYIFSAIFGK